MLSVTQHFILISVGLFFSLLLVTHTKKKTSFPSCTDSVLRNDSTRIVQPEVVFPMRSESHGSPNGPIERKQGTVAIGQSVFYTDFPPKEYGHSGKKKIFLFDIYSVLLV